MELATEIGFLKTDACMTLTVRVKHICADRWEAYYEGKWRKVIIGETRTYIKNNGFKLDIKIDGV